MVNSGLEPLHCSVFGNSKGLIENCFPFIIIKCVFLSQAILPLGNSVLLFRSLYMSCVPFLLFK